MKNTILLNSQVPGGLNIIFYWQQTHGLTFDYNSLEPNNYVGVAVRAININSGISSPFLYTLLPYA